MSCLWQCDGCGATRVCDPLAGDDWPDGVLRAVGPDCAECDIPMDLIDGEYDADEPDEPTDLDETTPAEAEAIAFIEKLMQDPPEDEG